MKKLINKIVKFFGFYTLDDYVYAYNTGRMHMISEVKTKADSLYGNNAEDWCKELYTFLKNNYLTEYMNLGYTNEDLTTKDETIEDYDEN